MKRTSVNQTEKTNKNKGIITTMDSNNKIYKASDASLNLSTTRLQKKRELLKHLSTISRHTQKPYVREKLLSI